MRLRAKRFPKFYDYGNTEANLQLFPHAEVAAAREFDYEESLMQPAADLGNTSIYMVMAGYGAHR